MSELASNRASLPSSAAGGGDQAQRRQPGDHHAQPQLQRDADRVVPGRLGPQQDEGAAVMGGGERGGTRETRREGRAGKEEEEGMRKRSRRDFGF